MAATLEESLKRKIVDQIIKKSRRTKWLYGGGAGECYMSIHKNFFRGDRFGVSVWREFDRWEGQEKIYRYRICFTDMSKMTEHAYGALKGVVHGPLVFETTYRAVELFEPIHRPYMAAFAKKIAPKPPPKEFSLMENLKRLLSSI